jgi:hypothetical protein
MRTNAHRALKHPAQLCEELLKTEPHHVRLLQNKGKLLHLRLFCPVSNFAPRPIFATDPNEWHSQGQWGWMLIFNKGPRQDAESS